MVCMNSMRFETLFVICFSALVFFAASTVFAQDETVTVRVDGRSLFRVGGAGNTTAENRAAQIERRLNSLLEKPEAIAPAQIESQGEERVVNVAGVTVVTITPTDAQENLTTADALAAQWATSVDNALERGRSRRLSSGGRFLNEIQASIETAFSRLLESAITIVPRFLAAVLVLGLFWLIAAGVRSLMRVIFRRIVEDLTVESLIKKSPITRFGRSVCWSRRTRSALTRRRLSQVWV